MDEPPARVDEVTKEGCRASSEREEVRVDLPMSGPCVRSKRVAFVETRKGPERLSELHAMSLGGAEPQA